MVVGVAEATEVVAAAEVGRCDWREGELESCGVTEDAWPWVGGAGEEVEGG